MMRDCQVVRSKEGRSEVMRGRARLSSRQYHDVARKLSRPPPSAAPGPPQIAAVACASVPASMRTACQPLMLCNAGPVTLCMHTTHDIVCRQRTCLSSDCCSGLH